LKLGKTARTGDGVTTPDDVIDDAVAVKNYGSLASLKSGSRKASASNLAKLLFVD